MAGLDRNTPIPQDITVHGASRVLEVAFSDGQTFRIPFELMRVYSPSAGCGPRPRAEVLQTGKRRVRLVSLAPIGNCIQPTFDDGQESRIFSWDYLDVRGSQQAQLWADYEARLQAAGVGRDDPMPVAAGHGCGHH